MLQSLRFTHFLVVRKNLLSSGKPVHDWHSDVHQDKIVDHLATTLSQIEFDFVVGLKSVQGGVCLELELARQDFLQRIYVELAIVNNQNSRFTLTAHLNRVMVRL